MSDSGRVIGDVRYAGPPNETTLDLALRRLARIAGDNQGNHMHRDEAKSLLAERDALRACLKELADRHLWGYGVGLCVCEPHIKARELLKEAHS